MPHLDEGWIHSWLDGALDAAEAERVEQHIATCEVCAAAVAEARGLIAGTSRLLSALDHVPSGVLPAGSTVVPAPARRTSARRWLRGPLLQMAIAASLLVVAVVAYHDRTAPGASTDLAVKTEAAPLAGPVTAPTSVAAPTASTAAGTDVSHELAKGQPPAAPSLVATAPASAAPSTPDTAALTRAIALDAMIPRRDSVSSGLRIDSIRRVDRLASADSTAAARDAAAKAASVAAIPAAPPAAVVPRMLAGAGGAAQGAATTQGVAGGVSGLAVGGGGGAAGARGGGGGGGGGGRGGRGGGGGGAAAGGRAGAPLVAYIGCYALSATPPSPLNRASSMFESPATRPPDRFSLRADTAADGVVRNTVRTLDSTGVENGIAPGLSWRYGAGGISIVTAASGIEQPLISIAPGPAGSFVVTSPGGAAPAPITRIPCTRLNGGGSPDEHR